MSGMSVSYLNEIEKGKKFPKTDKIEALANALDVTPEEITSDDLGNKLEPLSNLLRSNFLNELPLNLFGIEFSKVVEIIANAPAQVGAFIQTLVDIARKYELQEEGFYFSALRSYQEMHGNYFETIENSVDKFIKKYKIQHAPNLRAEQLMKILEDKYKCYINTKQLSLYPGLKGVHSFFDVKNNILHINNTLNNSQLNFVLAKELGIRFLELENRLEASSRVTSFGEVLDHFRSTYFAVALLLPQNDMEADLQNFFQQKKWQSENLLHLIKKYNTNPEIFLFRLTNLLPRLFNIEDLFYLRFKNKPGTTFYTLNKELHLNRSHHPHANDLSEHYCRRWISLVSLKNLSAASEQKSPLIEIQRSRYIGTADEYLCISIALPASPKPELNMSVTIGLYINDILKEKIKFLNDTSIPVREVNQTCQRCAVENCAERAAPPVVLQTKAEQKQIRKALEDIADS